MNYFKLFIVEDDPFYGELLKRHLQLNPDNEVILYSNGKDCLDNLHLNPDLISLDYRLPDMSGDEVMRKVHIDYPDLPIAHFTRVLGFDNDNRIAVAEILHPNEYSNPTYRWVMKDNFLEAWQIPEKRNGYPLRVSDEVYNWFMVISPPVY